MRKIVLTLLSLVAIACQEKKAPTTDDVQIYPDARCTRMGMVGIRRDGRRLRAHQTRHCRRAAAGGNQPKQGAGRCGQR